MSSSMPPPTWKLASEMLKKLRISSPSSAQEVSTTNTVRVAARMVRSRCEALKSCVYEM